MGCCNSKKKKANEQISSTPLTVPIFRDNQATESHQNEVSHKSEINEKQKTAFAKRTLKPKHGFTKTYTVVNKSVGHINYGPNQIASIMVQHNLTGTYRRAKMFMKESKENLDIIKFVWNNQLLHPNILTIYEIYEDEQYYVILEENLTGVLLDEYLQGQQRISEKNLAFLLQQILQAIQFLHKHHIVHGRLSLQSFQLVKDDLKYPFIKLRDYEKFIQKPQLTQKELIGRAPELVMNEACTEAGDIWACGIMAYQLITHKYPYPINANTKNGLIKHSIIKSVINYDTIEFDQISENGQYVFQRMLFPVHNRYTSKKLLESSWFKQCSEIEFVQKQNTIHSLQIIKKISLLESKILLYMINLFYPSQVNQLFKLFNDIDENKDGKLTFSELYGLFQSLLGKSIETQEVQRIIEIMDIDHNGKIEFQEFLIAIMDRTLIINYECLLATFKSIDTNNNGKLSIKELSTFFNLDQEIIQRDIRICFNANEKERVIQYLFYFQNFITFNKFKEIVTNLIK